MVKPDEFNSSQAAKNEAHTEIRRTDTNMYKTYPAYKWDKHKKISEIGPTAVPQLSYKVETHYGPQSDPVNTSGYGIGTRPEDKMAGTTSLRFHEGIHGAVFIQFIRDHIASNKFPVFTGKLGDDKKDFEKKVKKYERKVKAFDKMIVDAIEASTQEVDCVGKTIEEYHAEKGTVSKVTCK